MNRISNIVANQTLSVRIAFFTMMVCAAAIIAPSTYAHHCNAEYDEAVAVRSAFVDAAEQRAQAAEAYAAAVRSRNPVAMFQTGFALAIAEALRAAAETRLQNAVGAYRSCQDA